MIERRRWVLELRRRRRARDAARHRRGRWDPAWNGPALVLALLVLMIVLALVLPDYEARDDGEGGGQRSAHATREAVK